MIKKYVVFLVVSVGCCTATQERLREGIDKIEAFIGDESACNALMQEYKDVFGLQPTSEAFSLVPITNSLLSALANKNISPTCLETLLHNNPQLLNMRGPGPNYFSPLEQAVFSENISALRLFLEKKIFNLSDKNPQTGLYPVHVAAQNSRYKVIKILQEFNAQWNVLDDQGNTPLLLALQLHDVGSENTFLTIQELIPLSKNVVNVKNNKGLTFADLLVQKTQPGALHINERYAKKITNIFDLLVKYGVIFDTTTQQRLQKMPIEARRILQPFVNVDIVYSEMSDKDCVQELVRMCDEQDVQGVKNFFVVVPKQRLKNILQQSDSAGDTLFSHRGNNNDLGTILATAYFNAGLTEFLLKKASLADVKYYVLVNKIDLCSYYQILMPRAVDDLDNELIELLLACPESVHNINKVYDPHGSYNMTPLYQLLLRIKDRTAPNTKITVAHEQLLELFKQKGADPQVEFMVYSSSRNISPSMFYLLHKRHFNNLNASLSAWLEGDVVYPLAHDMAFIAVL